MIRSKIYLLKDLLERPRVDGNAAGVFDTSVGEDRHCEGARSQSSQHRRSAIAP
jgi:hypothetical protein